MLPKENRLSRKKFDHVYTNGDSVSGSVGYMKILKEKQEEPTQISCVVSSNEADTSVERTRIRRRAYAAIEGVVDEIPGEYSIIWFLPARAQAESFNNLRSASTSMLDKYGVFKD